MSDLVWIIAGCTLGIVAALAFVCMAIADAAHKLDLAIQRIRETHISNSVGTYISTPDTGKNGDTE